MPLSLFGRGTGNVKSQQLEHPSRGSSGTSDGKDWRGSVVKLPCHTVTLEKKLAEGGFAIVYLASDKQGHQYALKRQFISDDVRQLEACRRECRIVSCLAGHKNIISYVDHMILKNNCGVYECSLLTAFYKNSVLQLMNERHLAGRCLSAKEILKIFCDVCEAVARLHHSQTPVIHRDLKTENVLIDERQRDSPVYVLCDFGSATTKVLSSETQSLQFIEEEIHRYTTLGYRAPEMVDIYSGKTIGTKIDIWALGVMLYRLCYFSLPFGESSLAIQNCSYSFPTEPNYPEELRAIIKVLLNPDHVRRPDIYQVSTAAFEAAGQRCPVGNLNKVAPLRVVDVIQSFRQQEDIVMKEEATSSRTSAFANFDNFVAPKEVATSINPRLRPKPYGNVACLNLVDSSSRLLDVQNGKQQNCSFSPAPSKTNEVYERSTQKSTREAAEERGSETLKSSAFRPYSAFSENEKVGALFTVKYQERVPEIVSSQGLGFPVEQDDDLSWNPFLVAPFTSRTYDKDKLNENDPDEEINENDPDKEINENDPFAAAPIHSYQIKRVITARRAEHVSRSKMASQDKFDFSDDILARGCS